MGTVVILLDSRLCDKYHRTAPPKIKNVPDDGFPCAHKRIVQYTHSGRADTEQGKRQYRALLDASAM